MDESCLFTEAVRRGAGLTEDCYELSVLRMFRREHVGAMEDGEQVLCQYGEKAPQITQAIEGLSGEDSQKVWECLYVAGVVPAVLLITRGQWNEAYRFYRSTFEELQAVFLEENLEGYDSASWIDAWVEAKLADTPVEALASARGDAAARGGVIPLEDWRSHGWRLGRYLGTEASHA